MAPDAVSLIDQAMQSTGATQMGSVCPGSKEKTKPPKQHEAKKIHFQHHFRAFCFSQPSANTFLINQVPAGLRGFAQAAYKETASFKQNHNKQGWRRFSC